MTETIRHRKASIKTIALNLAPFFPNIAIEGA